MSEIGMTPLDLAVKYCNWGISPIPVPFREKVPNQKGWPDLRITAENASQYFNAQPSNIGALLIDGLVDMDFDCDEARNIADLFLPPTGFRFGRQSAPNSHWFYRAEGPLVYRKFNDPLRDPEGEDDKAVLLEIRAAGGKQTVLPGSMHPSGERIQFSPGATNTPQTVDAEVLRKAATRTAAAALLGRYFAKDGTRNEAFISLAGALARAGWSEDEVCDFNFAIYKLIWGHAANRAACRSEVTPTFRKFEAGSNIIGIPRLRELIDQRVVDTALGWLNLNTKSSQAAPDDWPQPIPLLMKPPEPMGDDVLPGVLGKYAQALARHTETPIDLSNLAVLGATSAALAGKIEVEAEPGYIEPALVWVCPLLESGNRKTSVVDAIRAPIDEFQDRERERLEPEYRRLASERRTKVATVEKLRKRLSVESPDALEAERKQIADLEAELPDEPHRITLTTQDTTPEALEELMEQNHGRMAILSDEGALFDILAGRYSSQPNLDCFLKGHTGSRVSVNRRCRSTFIPRSYLTVCIIPQPGVIRGLKDKPYLRERGLLARFLYALPESPVGGREHRAQSIPGNVSDDYSMFIKRLLAWQPERPIRLHLSDPAYREWKAFQREVEKLMADGGILDRLRDWGSKLPGAALRIAGLFSAVSQHPPEKIQLDQIERATALCAALIPHAIAAFDLVDEDPDISTAKRILDWLRRQDQPSVSKRECYRALHRQFSTVSEMDAPLRILADHFYVRVKDHGGKRSFSIEINPDWSRQ